MRLLTRLDAYATDEPGFREGHPEDRCPLCDRAVDEHVGVTVSGQVHPELWQAAKWPHRRAALRAIIAARWP